MIPFLNSNINAQPETELKQAAFSVTQFEDADRADWDAFIERSKNATFLHKIDYLHYHKDRFPDCSLLLWKKGKLFALMPGTTEGNAFYTHKGLTYGGLLLLPDAKMEDVIECFNAVNHFLQEKGIERVVYKAIPYIYAQLPAQEDEYALFRLDAKRISSGISTTIQLDARLPYHAMRKKAIKRAVQANLEIRLDAPIEDFWPILEGNLQKNFGVTPVHSLAEIKQLKAAFPENIRVYTAYKDDECVGGLLMYLTDRVSHLQYCAGSDKGKEQGALDLLFDFVITEAAKDKSYFDFGVSVENGGHYLNKGLIAQKQGFGGRGVVYQQFEYRTANQIGDLKEEC
ncbi:GNAT family N-acetyltransferase [Planococcus sp. YIM B11945]|uniref:GNAT family N-acetyltransferase n=1 Tax=Planococcus sp. YIM B11945 TaxID=3435410 RepID=UPI003D7C8ED9